MNSADSEVLITNFRQVEKSHYRARNSAFSTIAHSCPLKRMRLALAFKLGEKKNLQETDHKALFPLPPSELGTSYFSCLAVKHKLHIALFFILE